MRESSLEHEHNVALLIDADNASPDHLDEVLLVLGELGTINIRMAEMRERRQGTLPLVDPNVRSRK